VLAAGLLLVAYLAARVGGRRGLRELRDAWKPCLVLGVINAALPMTLVAWGEQHIDSSIAAIAQASVPIFVVLLSLRFLPDEPLGSSRVAGLAVGIAGVALVTGLHPGGDGAVGYPEREGRTGRELVPPLEDVAVRVHRNGVPPVEDA